MVAYVQFVRLALLKKIAKFAFFQKKMKMLNILKFVTCELVQ